MIISVHPSVKASSLKELIALAKAEPGRLSYASVGSGSAAHLTGELFKTAAGVDLLHVPYKGISQATTELIGGQVSMAFSNVVNVLPYFKSGKLRPIAVTGKETRARLAGRSGCRGDTQGLRSDPLVGPLRARRPRRNRSSTS